MEKSALVRCLATSGWKTFQRGRRVTGRSLSLVAGLLTKGKRAHPGKTDLLQAGRENEERACDAESRSK